jgi:cytochrome c-type biogenesis protein CcmF
MLTPDTHFALVNYQFRAGEPYAAQGPNYTAQRVPVEAEAGGSVIRLYPEVRHYPVRDSDTTEAAIHVTPGYDMYVALGRALDGKQLSVRAYLRPLIVWLWAGVAFMALGGMLALTDRIITRYS